ncbi:hypothetical protein CONCODRAFT_169817 [Conidiobolus coronatus NRRL 28638]|uniref:Uncharacterized protein n=1 Tax=Conidiobolus coronatus (strain ATCC 28846 / CBS 209.66 / NRRL 28638) TaxID=796925 RepID=A0A137NQV7_CONC2|nr:hypothetical protein CONCODRAFT_169817 [Conidiobolus coronatus NRRL 28638]|eukprot:KXN65115.1 hypothetical protein CONCODRAFT_169817 [Conidiobolus coronatus NRRL 28638]
MTGMQFTEYMNKNETKWMLAYEKACVELKEAYKKSIEYSRKYKAASWYNQSERLNGFLSKRVKPKNAKDQFNAIKLDEGSISTDQNTIADNVKKFYTELKNEDKSEEDIDFLIDLYHRKNPSRKIPNEDLKMLETDITIEEVIQSIKMAQIKKHQDQTDFHSNSTKVLMKPSHQYYAENLTK